MDISKLNVQQHDKYSFTFKGEKPFNLFFDTKEGYVFATRFGFVVTDNEKNSTELHCIPGVCHRHLDYINQWCPGNITHAVSQIRFGGLRDNLHNHEDFVDDWIDFVKTVLDKNISPYRELFNDLVVYNNDKGYPIAFSIKITEETSAQLYANLCIALRGPAEKSWFIPHWKNLRKKHSPLESLVLINTFGGPYNILFYNDIGHYPTDGGTVDLIQFMQGKPTTSKKQLLINKHKYTPCNLIWGYNHKYYNNIFEYLQNKKKVKNNTSLFKKPSSYITIAQQIDAVVNYTDTEEIMKIIYETGRELGHEC